MKSKTLTVVSAVSLAVGILVTQATYAAESTQVNTFKSALVDVATLDMPAKAASLIAAAPVKDQLATTIDVVKAAVALNPAAAPLIVGAIAKLTPSMAATAAATAAELQPKQAAWIAKAAASAAPDNAPEIAAAICAKLPALHASIISAVAKAVPSAKNAILAAVVQVLPNSTTVGAMHSSSLMPPSTAPAGAPAGALAAAPTATYQAPPANPIVTPPYVPAPVTRTEINPSDTTVEAPGSGNYATPRPH